MSQPSAVIHEGGCACGASGSASITDRAAPGSLASGTGCPQFERNRF